MLHTFIQVTFRSVQPTRKKMLMTGSILVLCLAFISSLLVSCGPATTTQTTPPPPAKSTHAPTPTPKPTQAPTPAPTTASAPTTAPAAPAILDLQPLSMSIVGHLDCNKTMTHYVCQARVLSRAANQSTLHWIAYADKVLGQVVFNPVSGDLAPGQSVVITISVPVMSCTRALFYFQGPINTHTIVWSC